MLSRKGFEMNLKTLVLVGILLFVLVAFWKPELFSIPGIPENGRNFGDKNLVTGFDKANIVQGDLFTIKIEEKWLTAREPGFCLPGGGGDSLSKGYAVLDEAKILTPQVSCGSLPGPFLQLTINSSKIPPGEHIIDVFSTYQYGPNNNGVRFGVESFAVNPTRYATNDYWVGAAKVFVQPAPCFLDSTTEVLVSQVFTAGKTISKEGMKWPVQKFCDSSPAGILRSDTSAIFQDYSLYYNLPYNVPPGFVVEIKYIAKKTDVGIDFVCKESEIYNADQNKCLVTALVRPCGDEAILLSDGTCIEFPATVCPGGTYYNASISEDNCIIDRCPAGSQWNENLKACAVRLRYSDQICSLYDDGGYSWNSDSCILPQITDSTGQNSCSSGASKVATTEVLKYNVVLNKTRSELGCDASKSINDNPTGCAFDQVPIKFNFYCSASPSYNCPNGSQFVEKDKVYYCQYGVETYRVCPPGTDGTGGSCISRETIEVDRVIVKTEIVERGIPVPYKVESPGVVKYVPVEKEVIVEKKVLPIDAKMLFVLALMIALATFLYALRKRQIIRG